METLKIRELPEKSNVVVDDLIIVEDNDGTKVARLSSLKNMVQTSGWYNSVADMQNGSYTEGDVIQTLGYREPGDGGHAIYRIVYGPTDTADNILSFYLHTSDTLRAKMIHDRELNVLQCGAYGDGANDDLINLIKLMSMGYPLRFPRRTYKLSSSLTVGTDTVLDFNNSIIVCNDAACLSIGLNVAAHNIIIKNAIFRGRYGIEVSAGAMNVQILNCKFDNPTGGNMNTGVRVNGARNVTISNCVFGESTDLINTGISFSSGTLNKASYGSDNIKISDCDFFISNIGIKCDSTTRDRAISISDVMMKGNSNSSTAFNLANNCDYMSISNVFVSSMSKGMVITGSNTCIVSTTDIIYNAVGSMFNVTNTSAHLHLNGIQKFLGGGESNRNIIAKGNVYIFERMAGTLYLNTTLETGVLNTADSLTAALQYNGGTLVDNMSPSQRKTLSITSSDKLTSNTKNDIPGYQNVAISLDFSGDVDNLQFPSFNGQVIDVYSSSSAKLKNGSSMDLGEDITLSKYKAVTLKRIDGTWHKIGG